MGVVLVSSTAISLVVVIIVSLAHKLMNKLLIRPKKMEKYLREQGFSGNPYKFLQGDLKEFSTISKAATSKTMDFSHDIGARVLPYEHHLAHKYASVISQDYKIPIIGFVNIHNLTEIKGNNSYMWFGAKPRLNIMDPVLVKEILSKPDEFHKIYPDPLADLVVGGLATAHGEKWARHRKIMNRGFDLEKLKGTLPEVYLSCNNMINEWKILVSTEQSSEIDAWPYIVKLARDMISRAAFGSNLEEGRRIFEITQIQADLAVQCMRASYIPWARHFQIKLNNEMKKLNREKMDQLRCIITKRAVEIGKENDKDDLLKVLMEATKKEKQEIGKGMTLEEVIDECKVLYAAGADPTAHVIAWTLILLSKYIDWQTLAREEVLHVLGNKKEFDLEVLNQLKVVTMILYEVLRLYPPAPVLVRATSKKIELANVTIPAFVQLSLPLIFHNHDASIWGEDAKQFNPQRFSEGIPNATRGSSLFFPFSSGPRTCIGQTFATIEAKMAISMILLNFSFKLSPTYIHAPEFIFLLRPKYGARIILHKI